MAGRDTSLDPVLRHGYRCWVLALLWRRDRPSTADELAIDAAEPTPSEMSYQLAVLERAGMVEASAEGSGGPTQRRYMVGGPNAGEAARRLGLSG